MNTNPGVQFSQSIPSVPDPVVLLTATIDTRDMTFVHRSDISLRLSDYRQSLKQWLKNKDTPKLIFCENSGYELAELVEFCRQNNPYRKEIEFLSFDDNTYPREYGKGYGELRIIGHVLANSRLIGPDTFILKVTGRLYCAGFSTIIGRIRTNPRADCYCNMNSDLSRAESYFFGASVSFLTEYLLPKKEKLNDSKGIFFEHILARAVHHSLSEGKVWSIIPGFIDLRGISGTTGKRYTRNLISRLKGRLFYLLKVFVLFRED